MNFGVHIPAMGPDSDDVGHIRRFVLDAEAVGFSSAWCGDHVVIPAEYESQHVTNSQGRYHWSHRDNFLEQFTLLSFVAGVTTRLDIGTSIFILPQRNPVVAAKQLATIEHLSQGRLHVGLGVGWLEEEYAALGVPFHERGRRFDENLAVLRGVMSGEPVVFDGDFTNIAAPMGFEPTPGPERDLPLYIASGGKGRVSEPALRRLVMCDGFMTAHEPPDVLQRLVQQRLLPAWNEAGRSEVLRIVARAPVDLEASSAKLVDLFHRYEEAGVTTFVLDNRTIDTRDGSRASLMERLGRFVDEVMPHFERVGEARVTEQATRVAQPRASVGGDDMQPPCTAIVE